MVFVDIVVANIWMAILLIGIGKRKRINKWLKADTSAIDNLKDKVSTFTEKIKRNPSLTDLMIIAAIAFGSVSIAHLFASFLAPFFNDFVANIENPTNRNIFTFLGSKFFWMISIATLIAILLSFTKAKNYEGAGASKFGSVFIYILVASIGMKMDLSLILDNTGLILIGIVWMSIHAGLLILIAKIIKAPYFFSIGKPSQCGRCSFCSYCRICFSSITCNRRCFISCFWLCGGNFRGNYLYYFNAIGSSFIMN